MPPNSDTARPPSGREGWLRLVATPIGNLEDITLRALRTLAEATVVAAEDTRKARVLLNSHGIAGKRLLSHHAGNERVGAPALAAMAAAGERVAFIAEAGTPCVSDPGFLLARECRAAGLEPGVVPGPSALTFAVAASGLPVDRFTFLGFPPVKPGRRRRFLVEAAAIGHTVFLFESPERLPRLLSELAAVCGGDAPAAVVREATKIHEEVVRGALRELAEAFSNRNVKGECVVGVHAGPSPPPAGGQPHREVMADAGDS